MARILILIGAHLCTAPRPLKEADALSSAGHDVTVAGCWLDQQKALEDETLAKGRPWSFQKIIDLRQGRQGWTPFACRLRRRLAHEIYARFGSPSPELLGYGARKMLAFARQFHADLTIVHSEAGLWVGGGLLDAGHRVGVDFEDWFSEDLSVEIRGGRPLAMLRGLEVRLARNCKYCLTTSHVMADAMAAEFGGQRPAVVYNTFPDRGSPSTGRSGHDRTDMDVPSLHWFSQTIGRGRGLETLMESLPLVRSQAQIHLRGNHSADSRQWIDDLIPTGWRDRVLIHSTVSNRELPNRIAEHDIGMALETPSIRSRDLTITNKLFQYLQAGLAVIATDTKGQREVLSQCPEAAEIIPAEDPVLLASAIDSLVGSAPKLQRAKAAALEASRSLFHWGKQSAVIKASAAQALAS